MLYHLVMIMISAVFAIAVVILFRRFAIVRKRRKEWQLKEMEFMNKLVSEGKLKPGQLSALYNFDEDRTIKEDGFKFKKTDDEFVRDEVHNGRSDSRSSFKKLHE